MITSRGRPTTAYRSEGAILSERKARLHLKRLGGVPAHEGWRYPTMRWACLHRHEGGEARPRWTRQGRASPWAGRRASSNPEGRHPCSRRKARKAPLKERGGVALLYQAARQGGTPPPEQGGRASRLLRWEAASACNAAQLVIPATQLARHLRRGTLQPG